jgi:large subunit ribosomal protein L9
MKVIFVRELPNIAQAGDTKEVADGYARNYLIPKGLAVIAKPGAATSATVRRQEKASVELSKLADQLAGLEISLKARAGARDRLYGAITTADIASKINETAGVAIDRRKIVLAKPIHQLGSYDVAIKLAKDIRPKVRVTITQEETA